MKTIDLPEKNKFLVMAWAKKTEVRVASGKRLGCTAAS